jgi:hypothetical protein
MNAKNLGATLATKMLTAFAFAAPPTTVGAWNLFGYDTAEQCIKENIDKVRFPDAHRLLGNACTIGYGKIPNMEKAWVNAGRCIVSDVKKLYSMEKSLAVINSCSNDSITYRVYYNYLTAAERDRREALIESARRRSYDSIQNGPMTIIDAQTGTMRMCHQMGNTVNCF